MPVYVHHTVLEAIPDLFCAESLWQAPGFALFSRRPLLRDLLERSPREQRGNAATRCFAHVIITLPQEDLDDDYHLARGARARELEQALAALHQRDFADLLGGDAVRYQVQGSDDIPPGTVAVRFGHAVYLPAQGEKIAFSASLSRDGAAWKPVCPVYTGQRLALLGGDTSGADPQSWPLAQDCAILLLNDGPGAQPVVQVRPRGAYECRFDATHGHYVIGARHAQGQGNGGLLLRISTPVAARGGVPAAAHASAGAGAGTTARDRAVATIGRADARAIERAIERSNVPSIEPSIVPSNVPSNVPAMDPAMAFARDTALGAALDSAARGTGIRAMMRADQRAVARAPVVPVPPACIGTGGPGSQHSHSAAAASGTPGLSPAVWQPRPASHHADTLHAPQQRAWQAAAEATALPQAPTLMARQADHQAKTGGSADESDATYVPIARQRVTLAALALPRLSRYRDTGARRLDIPLAADHTLMLTIDADDGLHTLAANGRHPVAAPATLPQAGGRAIHLLPPPAAMADRYCALLPLPQAASVQLPLAGRHHFGRQSPALAPLRLLDSPRLLHCGESSSRSGETQASADRIGLSREAFSFEVSPQGIRIARLAPSQALYHLDGQLQFVAAIGAASAQAPYLLPHGHHVAAGHYVLRFDA